jgi:hypothetical protein
MIQSHPSRTTAVPSAILSWEANSSLLAVGYIRLYLR